MQMLIAHIVRRQPQLLLLTLCYSAEMCVCVCVTCSNLLFFCAVGHDEMK